MYNYYNNIYIYNLLVSTVKNVVQYFILDCHFSYLVVWVHWKIIVLTGLARALRSLGVMSITAEVLRTVIHCICYNGVLYKLL